MSVPLEHDYIGLSDASSSLLETTTELRLGLPGFAKNFEENGTKFGNIKPGAKRGFSDVNLNGSGKWALSNESEADLGGNHKQQPVLSTDVKLVEDKKKGLVSDNVNSASSSKAQVVGWPPIRSFRKNTISTNLSKSGDIANSPSKGYLYVKVSMDGAPFLRKIDLKIYHNYTELSNSLEKMFSCFTLGQYNSNGIRGREGLSESNLKDLLHGSESVLTYEDKDGDWMLVGDVPWEMFIDSCKRLRIMRSSEAIGLAPRLTEKCKN